MQYNLKIFSHNQFIDTFTNRYGSTLSFMFFNISLTSQNIWRFKGVWPDHFRIIQSIWSFWYQTPLFSHYPSEIVVTTILTIYELSLRSRYVTFKINISWPSDFTEVMRKMGLSSDIKTSIPIGISKKTIGNKTQIYPIWVYGQI